MKKLITSFGIMIALLVLADSQAFSQQKVTEDKLIGTWRLIIDIEQEMEEARQEAKDDDNILGEMILSGVAGLVEGIMENIEIYFEFRPGGEVIIYTEAFDETEDEPEYAEWYINKDGELYIEDSGKVNVEIDDYWMMDGSRFLVAIEEGEGPSENVYMRKIE